MSAQPRSPIESGTGQKPAPWKWASWLVVPTGALLFIGHWWLGLFGIVLILLLSLQYAMVRIQARPFAKPAPLQMRPQTLFGTAVMGVLVHMPIWLGDIVLTFLWNTFSRQRHHRGRRVRRQLERYRESDRRRSSPGRRATDEDDDTWEPDDAEAWFGRGGLGMPEREPRLAVGTTPLSDRAGNPVERAVRWLFGR